MGKIKNQIAWLNYGMDLLVVVIGILIAFQLNRWAAERQQATLVDNHLQQIREEAKFNRATLQSTLELNETNLAKLDTIFTLLRTSKDYDKINEMSMDLLNLGVAYFRKNAYENLTESGDFRFIREFDLRQQVVRLYETYKLTESYDEISRNLYMQDYFPYLQNHFDLSTGDTQAESVYQSQLFKNILVSYKRTSENRIQRYRNCLDIIDDYLSAR